jgi:hypothetical protein
MQTHFILLMSSLIMVESAFVCMEFCNPYIVNSCAMYYILFCLCLYMYYCILSLYIYPSIIFNVIIILPNDLFYYCYAFYYI